MESFVRNQIWMVLIHVNHNPATTRVSVLIRMMYPINVIVLILMVIQIVRQILLVFVN